MKFGDIVVNEWASDSNPHKVLMFVNKGSRYIYCLARHGERVKFYTSDHRLTVIGHIDFSKWHELCDERIDAQEADSELNYTLDKLQKLRGTTTANWLMIDDCITLHERLEDREALLDLAKLTTDRLRAENERLRSALEHARDALREWSFEATANEIQKVLDGETDHRDAALKEGE